MSDNENDIIDVEVVEINQTPSLPVVIPEEASNCETIELPNRQDALLADNPERRCAAHKRNGERCRKFAIMGSTVCRTHGGATKHVKNKARVRVENASDRLMGRLIQFAFDDTKPPDIQLRAMRDALDRAGLRPPAEVVLSQGEAKPYEELFDGIAAGSRAESRRVRGLPDTDERPAGFEIGTEGPSQPPPQGDSPGQGDNGEGCARRVFRGSTTNTPEVDYQGEGGGSGQQDSPSGANARLRQPHPHDFDREREAQPPVRHITGDDAIDAANWANRRIGALKAIESPHRRYSRP